ncbi:hypothetical protein FTX61_13155 [Nitriliruptoraceae bacterium ZYF776]|nr:hypothetical protein [Profundirhabdus halotolerans]
MREPCRPDRVRDGDHGSGLRASALLATPTGGRPRPSGSRVVGVPGDAAGGARETSHGDHRPRRADPTAA